MNIKAIMKVGRAHYRFGHDVLGFPRTPIFIRKSFGGAG
jgi:hypothetical protein